MKTFFYLIFFFIFIMSCGKRDKEYSQQEKNKEYFLRLKNFTDKETGFNIGEGNSFVFIIRHYDCSCNDKNLIYDKELLRKGNKSFRRVIIFIDDKKGEYTKRLDVNNEAPYNDTTRQLEKYGNLFIADKLFVIDKGRFTAMFDLEVDNRKRIDNFLSDINEN